MFQLLNLCLTRKRRRSRNARGQVYSPHQKLLSAAFNQRGMCMLLVAGHDSAAWLCSESWCLSSRVWQGSQPWGTSPSRAPNGVFGERGAEPRLIPTNTKTTSTNPSPRHRSVIEVSRKCETLHPSAHKMHSCCAGLQGDFIAVSGMMPPRRFGAICWTAFSH